MNIDKFFNVISFKQNLKDFPLWIDMYNRHIENPLFIDNNKLLEKIYWKDFKNECTNLDKLKILNKINNFWNSKKYIPDKPKQDYWKCPYEFNMFGGDCEDYSIVKYFTLKELCIDINLMKILILQNITNKLGHAVLTVNLDNTIWVLDNLKNNINKIEEYQNYEPKYSVNELNKWVYIRIKK